jgi:hypothetical protein
MGFGRTGHELDHSVAHFVAVGELAAVASETVQHRLAISRRPC